MEEAMKKSYKIIFAALAVLLVVFHFAVPRKAVRGEYRIHAVEKNSHFITEKLTTEDIDRIESLVEAASCTRWKNPIGSFPAYDDTVCLLGIDDRGPCTIVLAGSSGEYGVDDHIIRDGEALWKAVLEILP